MTGLIRRALRWLPPTTIVRVVTGPLQGARWMVGAAPHGAWLGRLYQRRTVDGWLEGAAERIATVDRDRQPSRTHGWRTSDQ
jgi:hypothetical protein